MTGGCSISSSTASGGLPTPSTAGCSPRTAGTVRDAARCPPRRKAYTTPDHSQKVDRHEIVSTSRLMMFKRRTLFILGAGASHEVGLPVGIALAQQIRKMVDIRFEGGFRHTGEGDLSLYEHLTRTAPHNRQSYQFAGWLIRDGILLSSSIDDFLDQHQDNEEVKLYGKAATVKCILEGTQFAPICQSPKMNAASISANCRIHGM
jgi:hypothetical protein